MDKFVLSLKKDLQDSKICSVSSTVQKLLLRDQYIQYRLQMSDNKAKYR